MKLSRKLGSTNQIFQIFIRDSSSTTGGGLTGLAYNTASLTAYYHRDTDSPATSISLVDMTVGTFTSSGFKQIDATNMPGWYQFCPPNASLASGATSVVYHLKGAANMAPTVLEIDLLSQVDITSIAGTSQTARDIGASVLLSSGTGAGQISLSSGAVTVGTNSDKTGYSLAVNDSPIVQSGTAQAGAGTTITLSSGASSTDNIYNGQTIKTTGGTGSGQVRVIISYVGSTKVATINRAWQTNPDNTTTYAVLATDSAKTNSFLEVVSASVSGSVGSVTGGVTVTTNNDKTGYSLTQAFPTNFSSLSITAGGLVDITQTAADKVWGTTTRRLSDGTNIVLAKGVGVTGFNDLSGSEIATAVWQDTTAGDFTVAGSIGKSLFTSGNVPGAAGGLFIAGTNAATTVTTSFTTTFTGNLTGSVGSVTGLTASNLDVAVSSRMASYTQPTGFLSATFPSGTIANTTNITAGTITTATNVTNVSSGGITRASFAADTGLQTVRSNTAQAGGSTTITLDASASSTNNYYNNQLCYLTGGTGVGQSRFITAYNGTTKVATVNSAWATNPDNTTTFAIIEFDSIPGATAPTAAQVATAVWTDLLAGSDFSTASSVGKLLKDNLDAAVSSRMATFTLPTNFSSLSINGSGLVDITQTAADKVWGTGTRVLTAGTNIVLAKGTGITGFNDIAATAIVSGGAITTSGGAVSTVTSVTNGVTVSTNNDKTGYSLTQAFPTNFALLAINGSGQVTVGAVDPSVTATASLDPASITAVVTAVWQDTTAGDFTVAGSIGKSLFTGGNVPGASGGLFISGTNAATTITGSLTTTFTGNLTGSVNSVATGVTVSTNNDKTGYSLTQTFPSNFSALSITAGGLVDITQTAADKAWSTSSRTLTAATNLTGMSVNVASYSAGQTPLQPTVSGRTLNVSATGLGDSDVKALNGDTAAAAVQSSANKVIYKGSVTSTTGPTSITDSALPNVTNNNWKGRVIVFLTGSLQYQATDITANTGTTLNFTSLTGTPSVSDQYLIF